MILRATVLGVYQQGRVSRLTNANIGLSSEVTQLRQEQGQLRAEQTALTQAGKTRQGADTASLGVCATYTTEYLDNYTPPVTVITSVTITSPTLTAGVASCPQGGFIPVAPQGS